MDIERTSTPAHENPRALAPSDEVISRPMIDHMTLRVRDYDSAKSFYEASLAPLGYVIVMSFPDTTGFGIGGKPDFWLAKAEQAAPIHIAFAADRTQVAAFHRAAIAAGGKDNGAPGIRADYHPNYYGAFILDAEGNNIEVVCHDPPGGQRRAAPAKKSAKKTAKPAAKKAVAKAPKKAAKKPAKAPKKAAKKKTAKKR
jgi:catechol 2,3-dioxygenase-like lactoylglutathione lyase family enzyme